MPQQSNNQLVQQQIIIKTNLDLAAQPDFENFRQALAACIHELISKDFNRLILLLYRLDINEKKLKEKLALSPPDAGLLIADMIIAREEEKIKSREQFKRPLQGGDPYERW